MKNHFKIILAATLIFLGLISESQNKNRKSDSLIAVLKNSPGDTGTAVLLNNIAEALRSAYPDSSSLYSDSARKLCEKLNFKRGLANSLFALTNHYSTRNKYNLALNYALKALSIFQELKDVTGEAHIYRSIGTIYFNIQDNENALKYYEQGLAIVQKLGMKKELPGFLSNIGIVWHSKLDFGKAMDYYIQALKAAEANKDNRSRSYVLNSLGKLYFDIGKKDENAHDFDEAINYYSQALDLKREMGDKRAIANTLGNIGEVQTELGKYTEALYPIDQVHIASI